MEAADADYLKRECLCIDGARTYTCTLKPDTAAKALKELNEKVEDREDAIVALRSWLSQQRHIKTRTGWLCIVITLYNAYILKLFPLNVTDIIPAV